MTDETDEYDLDAPYRRRGGLLAGARKILYALGALIVVYAIGSQAIHKAMHRNNATHVEHSPERAWENSVAPSRDDKQVTATSETSAPPAPMAPAAAEKQVAPVPSDTKNSTLQEMQSKLDALQQQTTAQSEKAQPADADMIARITQLEDKINQQEQTLAAINTQLHDVQANANRQLAALTAFGQLKQQVMQGEPYDAALSAMAALANPQAQAALQALKPGSAQGIATLMQLQANFAASIQPALSGAASGSMLDNMKTLIRIRKIGNQPGSDDQAVIARAETLLNQGDVAGAAKELNGLSPTGAGAFTAWRKQAQDYLDARRSLDALQLALVQPATRGSE